MRYSLVTLAVNFTLNLLFIGLFEAGVWGFVLSKLAVTVCGSIYLLGRTWRQVGARWDRTLIPEFVRFGTPLAISGLAYFLIHFSDRFFLTASVSLAALGQYGLAYRFAFLVSVLIGDSFGKSWNATFYRYTNEDGWKQQFAQVASVLMFVRGVTGLGIAVFGPELLRLMVPPSFFPPHLLLPMLVFAYVFREFGDFFRNLLLINKRAGLVGRIAVGGALLNVLLNWLLILPFGIMGAAASTMLTWVIYLIVCWVIAHREHRVPVRFDNFLFISGLTASIYALSDMLRIPYFVPQVLLDGAWVLLFAGLCICFYFGPADRRYVLDMLATLVARVLARGYGLRPRLPAVRAGGPIGRVLLLAYYYPPENVSGAHRPRRFARHLARAGFGVTVISSSAVEGGPEGEEVLRVPRPAGEERRLDRRSRLIRRIEARVAAVRRPAALDTARDGLGRPAAGTSFDVVIISSHPPIATHLAAMMLKRRHGVSWIADFRDPLAGNPFRVSRRAAMLDPIIERLVFEQADAVIANTDAVAVLWRERHPQFAHKVHLIWNGFNRDDVIAPRPPRPRSERLHSPIELVHLGTLYGARTPISIASCLSRLAARGMISAATVRLSLIGALDRAATDLSREPYAALISAGIMTVDNGMVPHEEALSAMLAADMLLLLDVNDRNTGLQVPAKTFEYILSCRPILAFTPPGSATERVLTISGIPCLCIDPMAAGEAVDDRIIAFLTTHREAVDSGEIVQPSEAFWREFDAERQSETLVAIIEALGSGGSLVAAPEPALASQSVAV